MMVTLYKVEDDGRIRYYTLHDHQYRLGDGWGFTVVWSAGSRSQQRFESFDGQAQMDARLRACIKRKFGQGYRMLYAFSGRRWTEERMRDLSQDLGQPGGGRRRA